MGEYGVRAADLEAQRAALIEFAEEMYGPLARCDQRAKGEQYVRGLLLEGRRKSIQPMAARLPDGDEQGLQQFITDSPWRDEPVRRRLAAADEPRRSSRSAGSWMTPGCRRTGGSLRGSRTSTAGRLGRRRTVRCWCRSTPRPIGRRARWGGGCSCPRAGIRMRSVVSGRGSLRRCGTSRSGSSRWRSWTS